MFACEFCGSDWPYEASAAECAEQDALEDRNTREWFSNYNPHRKD
jgi:hypothetical protein